MHLGSLLFDSHNLFSSFVLFKLSLFHCAAHALEPGAEEYKFGVHTGTLGKLGGEEAQGLVESGEGLEGLTKETSVVPLGD